MITIKTLNSKRGGVQHVSSDWYVSVHYSFTAGKSGFLKDGTAEIKLSKGAAVGAGR